MKILLIVVSSLVFSTYSFSQIASYIEQTSGVTADMKSAYAVNPSVGWVCGYQGTVLRTTNGGSNWLNVSGNGIPSTRLLINVFGIDAGTALAAGYEGANTYVYRTSNAGANWTQVFTENNGFINSVWMISNLNGFMQGDPVGGRWSLWKTTNGGVNWDSAGLYLQQAGSEAGWNNSMFIEAAGTNSRIWFGTNNTRVYYSSNYGTTWNVQTTGSEINTYAISYMFVTGGDALAGGTNMIRTTNYGTLWSPVTSAGTGNFGGFTGASAIADNPYIAYSWYVRNTTSIYNSMNNGTNWNIAYTAPAGLFRHISPTNSFNQIGVFWAVRSNGGITRGTYSIGGIEPVSNEIAEKYSLSQNYPNPFNPGTTFRFSIPERSHVKLKVFNSAGMEIESLLEKELSPAVYEVNWNASKYSSGVYFYRIETESFIETKKMMLIK